MRQKMRNHTRCPGWWIDVVYDSTPADLSQASGTLREDSTMTTRRAGISRRGLLKKGAAAAAAGAALAPQSASVFGQAPAVVAGRTFRAWISRGTGRGRTT